MLVNRKPQYICGLKINGKITDKKEMGDFETWNDKITYKVYGISLFRKIEIKIKAKDR